MTDSVQKTLMIPLYANLLSGYSVLSAPEAAEDLPVPLCFDVNVVHNYDSKRWNDFAYSSFNVAAKCLCIVSVHVLTLLT